MMSSAVVITLQQQRKEEGDFKIKAREGELGGRSKDFWGKAPESAQ